MISETLLVPIITGGFIILSGCTERLMNWLCPEVRKKTISICCPNEKKNVLDAEEHQEEHQEETREEHREGHREGHREEISINSYATSILKIVWEEPNIGKDKFYYTSKTNNNKFYSVEIPANLNHICVYIYQEFSEKPENGNYYLNAKLSNINNSNNVKLFIKRFREKGIFNKEWVSTSFQPFQGINAENGINMFNAKSLIGSHDILHEQIGIMIESQLNHNTNCIIERAYLDDKPMY